MRTLFTIMLIVILFRLEAQNGFLTDTSMIKAFSPHGLHNPGKDSINKFHIIGSDGNIYTSENLKDKVTFINFWIKSCPPCIAEFEALNHLYAEFGENKDFQFLSFTFESPDEIQQIIAQYHLPYTVLSFERDSLYKLMFNLGFPTSMIIDRRSKIRLVKCGGFDDAERNSEMIESIYSKEIEKLLTQ